MTEKNAHVLWQDYRFLTREMKKFLSQQNLELFYELLNQRERLQRIIEETPDKEFKVSHEGKKLFSDIQRDNQYIVDHLQMQSNRSKKSHQVAEVYSGTNMKHVSRMNWKG